LFLQRVCGTVRISICGFENLNGDRACHPLRPFGGPACTGEIGPATGNPRIRYSSSSSSSSSSGTNFLIYPVWISPF
jgi:hypothetical protein